MSEAFSMNSTIKSMKAAMVASPRDWSADYRDAWIYGILVGWNRNALRKVAAAHGWDGEILQKLKRHRQAIEDAEGKP